MRRAVRTATTFAIAIGPLSLPVARVLAGEITAFNCYSDVASEVASLATTSIVASSAPNNVNVASPSPNQRVIRRKNASAGGPVDIVVGAGNTLVTTDYLFIEGVFNNADTTSLGCELEFGFGRDTGFAKSASGDGLDFDAPEFDSPLGCNPSPDFFPVASPGEDRMFGSPGYFHFSAGVPDGVTEFTVDQSSIPTSEPDTPGPGRDRPGRPVGVRPVSETIRNR